MSAAAAARMSPGENGIGTQLYALASQKWLKGWKMPRNEEIATRYASEP